MSDKNTNLVWIDIETTGLDVENNRIIEIATIITDKELNILAEGPNLVIHQSNEILNAMGEWCTKQHGNSGLTHESRMSYITESQAEEEILAFIQQYVAENEAPLCGNSVHFDRKFLEKYMPKLSNFLHYRNIDVSTVRELMTRWTCFFDIMLTNKKPPVHRSLADIKMSIKELQLYKIFMFEWDLPLV